MPRWRPVPAAAPVEHQYRLKIPDDKKGGTDDDGPDRSACLGAGYHISAGCKSLCDGVPVEIPEKYHGKRNYDQKG